MSKAQPIGCSSMRQLAPVKRPNENKREGEGNTPMEGKRFSHSACLHGC